MISDWLQNMLENLLLVSPALVHRICTESRGHIESRLAANDVGLKNLEVGAADFSLSGVLVNAKFDSRACLSLSMLLLQKRIMLYWLNSQTNGLSN